MDPDPKEDRLSGAFRRQKGLGMKNKVLIIEDEILARVGLHQLLDWKGLGFTLLEDAKDGQEAIRSIEENHPDILLLDLNIPKKNGLQILEYLRENNLDCKVIVISCNEEFEMVKEAMKLGAYDYLRKLNLSSEELQQILQKCRAEKHQPFRVREIRYEEIISHTGKDIFQDVGTYRTLLCILPHIDKQEGIFAVTEHCRRWFQKRGQEYLQIHKGAQCCYFVFDSRLPKVFYEELYRALAQRFPIKLYLGIYEGVMKEESDMNQAVALAEQINMVSYYDEEQRIHYFTEKIPAKEHSPKGMPHMQAALKQAAAEFAREETGNAISNIFSSIRQEKYISMNVLRRIFMDMLGVFSMTAQGLNGAIEEIQVRGDNCHYQCLLMISSLSEIEKWFLEFTDAFHERFLIEYKCSRSEILRSAFHYIDTHLKTQIHQSEAAKEIGVSSAYLSTVFKKEMGQNFIEYVNLRKVELAKEMLEEGLLVYEVSEILGFENCTYFSKVFKKYTEMSPDTYRKSSVVNDK